MNSKKEYGANSVIRQTVLYKDQVAEDEGAQEEDRERPRAKDNSRSTPSCSVEEEKDPFKRQYAQRAKNRRRQELDRLGGQKRSREEADPIELGLLGRPNSKHGTRKTRQSRVQR